MTKVGCSGSSSTWPITSTRTCVHTCKLLIYDTYTCTHACTHTSTHTCTHSCTHTSTHMHTHTHAHTHMYTHICTHRLLPPSSSLEQPPPTHLGCNPNSPPEEGSPHTPLSHNTPPSWPSAYPLCTPHRVRVRQVSTPFRLP